jgi:hypothetical protein
MPSCVFCTKKYVVQQKGCNLISWEESHGWPLTDIHIVSLSCSQQSTWTFQKLMLIALWGFNLHWSTLIQQRVNQYPLALLVKSSPPLSLLHLKLLWFYCLYNLILLWCTR